MKLNRILVISIILLAILSFNTVFAEDIVQDEVSSQNYDTDIYVSADGSDSNDGSQNSPYLSLNKAISQVNESQNVAIHVGEGTFSEGNIYIDLNNSQNNGKLSIIGAGFNKTIFNGKNWNGVNSKPLIMYIGGDSNVFISNLSFVNFNSGGDELISTVSIRNGGGV